MILKSCDNWPCIFSVELKACFVSEAVSADSEITVEICIRWVHSNFAIISLVSNTFDSMYDMYEMHCTMVLHL